MRTLLNRFHKLTIILTPNSTTQNSLIILREEEEGDIKIEKRRKSESGTISLKRQYFFNSLERSDNKDC